MKDILLQIHSLVRWAVLFSLLYAIIMAGYGWLTKARFTKAHNVVRHSTATISHIQLLLGILLYTQSPITTQFLEYYQFKEGWNEVIFFGCIHISLMIISIIIITLGSSLAKRKEDSKSKFRIIFIYFLIALLIILMAIPWPFSPLADRPLIRTF